MVLGPSPEIFPEFGPASIGCSHRTSQRLIQCKNESQK
jgi:hypothetical protein